MEKKDIKIVIDAGHGGHDVGASFENILEKDLVLDISFYQLDRLHSRGYQAIMTRYGDETLSSRDRIIRINSFNPDYIISNHINAGGGEGAEVIHSATQDGKLANKILDGIVEKGQKRRRVFFKTLKNSNRDFFFIHRETRGRAVIVEYGFIDNENDRKRMNKNLRKYAESVVYSLDSFIK